MVHFVKKPTLIVRMVMISIIHLPEISRCNNGTKI